MSLPSCSSKEWLFEKGSQFMKKRIVLNFYNLNIGVLGSRNMFEEAKIPYKEIVLRSFPLSFSQFSTFLPEKINSLFATPVPRRIPVDVHFPLYVCWINAVFQILISCYCLYLNFLYRPNAVCILEKDLLVGNPFYSKFFLFVELPVSSEANRHQI